MTDYKLIYLLAAALIFLSPPLLSKDYQKSEKMISDILKNNNVTKDTKEPSKNTSDTDSKDKEENKSQQKTSPTEDEVLHKTGIELFEGGYNDHSASNFKQLIERFPGSIYTDNACIYLGKIELKKYNYKDAVKYFQKIKKDSGEYPASLYYTAEALNYDKQYIKSIELYKKVSASFPDHEVADNALLNLSKLYIKVGNGQKSLEALIEILKSYRDRETIDDAYYLLGTIYLRDKKLRDIETTRKIYKSFILKSDKGEKYFKDSPLLPVVKKELNDLEKIFFNKYK